MKWRCSVRTGQHERKLPGVEIPEKIRITNDLKEAMTDKDVLVLAVPSAFIRSTARNMKAFCGAPDSLS